MQKQPEENQQQAMTEYHARIMERVARAQSGWGNMAADCLTITIGARNWLIRLNDIAEVASLPHHIRKIPSAEAWVVGAANIRGTIYTLVDLGVLLRGEPSRMEHSCKVFTAGSRYKAAVAFVTDRPVELRQSSDFAALPGKNAAEPWVATMLKGVNDGALYAHIHMPGLLHHSDAERSA